MSEATHTPGPWTVSTEDLRGGRYYSVSRGENDGEPIDLHETENGEADAHLIAAAPDMLAALKAARKYVSSMNEAEHMMDGFGPRREQPSDLDLDVVDRAISKAEPTP